MTSVTSRRKTGCRINPIDTIAKFSASFKDEADLKSVLAKDFSIEPEASLAAAFVVAWRAAQARTREQADREAAGRG